MTPLPANNPSTASADQAEAVAVAPDIGSAAVQSASTDVESLLDELERLSNETDVWAGAADEAAQAVADGAAPATPTRSSAAPPEPQATREPAADAEPDAADSEAALRQLDSVLAQAAESLADGADAEEAIAGAAEAQSARLEMSRAGGTPSDETGADTRGETIADGFSTVDDVVREVAAEFDAGEAPPVSASLAPAVAAAAMEPTATKPGGDPEASRLLNEKDGTRSGKAPVESSATGAAGAGARASSGTLPLLLAPLAALAIPMKLLSVGARNTIGHLALVTLVCGGGVWYAVKYVPRKSAPLTMSDLVVFKTKEDAPGHGSGKADDHGGGGKKASKDAHGKGDGHGAKPAEKKAGSSGHAKPAAKGGKDKKDAKGGGHH